MCSSLAGARPEGLGVSTSFHKAASPVMVLYPHDLIVFQRLHLQTPSHGELGFNRSILGGHKHSVCSTWYVCVSCSFVSNSL